ncbi:biotin-dependent carboxyltransferase family protein [Flagellimonas meishanensis]|uniref:5-oxoprolinase subunit C family protein n=1 Tax=Flagellimonas meishanensis TaxID=2873264 RepID=UPI001CA75418|nr:biotin-dependent carboxyltransferase family protein [[Muricauda] meishanensis]
MVKILKAGFYSTLQDLGRLGFRDKGVPISGVMDEVSATRANLLLENEAGATLMEMTMTGPTLQFESHTYICISGADMLPSINGKAITNYRVIKVAKNDVLTFGKLQNGFRSYLAVKGGFGTEKVLGSQSQYFPVTLAQCLKEGDEIPYKETSNFAPAITELKTEAHFEPGLLKVNKGPEYELLDDGQLASIFSKSFTISKQNNRMAYQLGETIKGHDHSMLTSGTLPGTVQLTPSGRIIILMKDGQTTGGYPRIFQLSKESICILAQKKSRDIVSFELLK